MMEEEMCRDYKCSGVVDITGKEEGTKVTCPKCGTDYYVTEFWDSDENELYRGMEGL